MSRRIKWAVGERLMVVHCGRDGEFELAPPALGTIVRKLMRDESAWVRLDKREREEVHPFPADDEHGRATDVLTWADLCEPIASRIRGRHG